MPRSRVDRNRLVLSKPDTSIAQWDGQPPDLKQIWMMIMPQEHRLVFGEKEMTDRLPEWASKGAFMIEWLQG